jgi:hypothetical protein
VQGSILIKSLWQAAGTAVLLLSSSNTAAETAAAGPPPRTREVEEMVRQAEAAVGRLDVARARDLWAQIHAIEHSTVSFCQLGQLDRRLGHWEDAMAELSECIERMPAPRDAKERRLYEVRHADLAMARQRVGEVQVIAPLGAVRVLVDGMDRDARRRLYLAPGQHEVKAVGKQGETARALVNVEAGRAQSIALTFDEGVRPPLRGAPPTAPASPSVRSAVKPWIMGGGIIGSVAFAAVGVGLRVDGASSAADIEGELDAARNASPPDYAQIRARLQQQASTAETVYDVGTAALVAGATLGAATLVYVVVGQRTQVRARTAGVEVTYVW